MSKIGKKTIDVPEGVDVTMQNHVITVKGPEGVLTVTVPHFLKVTHENGKIDIARSNDAKQSKSSHGLYRQLIYNAVTGVKTPWQKRLEVVGTGFGVKSQNEDIVFKIGFSHQVVFKKVVGVTYAVEGNNKVVVSGSDKQLVGQVAHKIKALRKPDPYKGKGIRYEGEKLKLKPGKKAKTAGA